MAIIDGVYGFPDPDLTPAAPGAVQLSPLVAGAGRLEDLADGSCGTVTVLAPQGVLERRFTLAHALRTLVPGGRLIALAPKDRGGQRLSKELVEFGCAVDQVSRRHHRICTVVRPDRPLGLGDAIAAGNPQIPPALRLWSQPGVFSWDRPDLGSLMLIRHLPQLAGSGADLGCGVGLLALAALESQAIQGILLADIDRRAIEAARRNVPDPRAEFLWGDVRQAMRDLRDLDFVIMNPPFHDGGAEDRSLGKAFIRRAAAALKPGGACWLVANRHLPYEAYLKTLFASARQVEQGDGFKIYEARR
jgi:16S rRNA (guanine1207-N2)-methyltransferase